MRDFKNMKRQRSRNRGNGGGNSGRPQQNANRAFESNGPDGVKIRGAAQHVFEKYQQLARDALTAGDRVLGESYQQHAEHYFRVLRAVQPQRPASDIIGRDAFASGFDIDFEDESGETESQPEIVEAEASDSREWRQEGRRDERPREDRQARDDRPRDRNVNRDERPRDDRPREDRPRDDRPRDDRNTNRDDRPRDDRQQRDRNFNRDDRPRDERPREDRQARDDRPREDRPRDERPRDDRPREERQRDDRRPERPDPLAVIEPRATPLTAEVETNSSPMLRSHDGGVSHAPAFLQSQSRPEPAPEQAAEAAAPKPRRRRTPRAADAKSSPVVSSEES